MTQRFKTSVLYQIWESRVAILIFYIVRTGVITVFFPALLMLLASGETSQISFNGLEFSTLIFLFIAGLNSFSTTFRCFLQNGLSRSRLVLSYAACMVILALAMALLDGLNLLLPAQWVTYESLFGQAYGPQWMVSAGGIATSLLWGALLNFRVAMLGYFITALYYRMSRLLKVLVSVGVPVLFVVILPMMEEMFTKGAIVKAIGRYLVFEWYGSMDAGHPWNAIVFSVLYSAVFLGLAWLLIKGAQLKNQE